MNEKVGWQLNKYKLNTHPPPFVLFSAAKCVLEGELCIN